MINKEKIIKSTKDFNRNIKTKSVSKWNEFYNNRFRFWLGIAFIVILVVFIPTFSVGFYYFFSVGSSIMALALILTGLIGVMFGIGFLCIASMWHGSNN